MDGNELFFFGHNIACEGAGEGKWGDYGMNPKPKKKIVARSRVLRNNYFEELFHTVPSSFVLRDCCYTELYAFVCASEIRVRINEINFPNHLFMYSLHHFYVCKSG